MLAPQQLSNMLLGISSTTLRAVIGDINLDEVLSRREQINEVLRVKLDEVTERWGGKVTSVEIREITPPRDVQDAMNRQLSAERTRRAVITESEGARQAAINVAEGQKQAEILKAEGERQAAILRAEGFSQALERIFQAATQVDEKTMALQYLEALKDLGASPSTKFIIPTEFSRLAEQIGDYVDRGMTAPARAARRVGRRDRPVIGRVLLVVAAPVVAIIGFRPVVDRIARRLMDAPRRAPEEAGMAPALDRLGGEVVRLRSRDGLRLTGRWLEAEPGGTWVVDPREAILLLHGWTGSVTPDLVDVGPFLRRTANVLGPRLPGSRRLGRRAHDLRRSTSWRTSRAPWPGSASGASGGSRWWARRWAGSRRSPRSPCWATDGWPPPTRTPTRPPRRSTRRGRGSWRSSRTRRRRSSRWSSGAASGSRSAGGSRTGRSRGWRSSVGGDPRGDPADRRRRPARGRAAAARPRDARPHDPREGRAPARRGRPRGVTAPAGGRGRARCRPRDRPRRPTSPRWTGLLREAFASARA